MIIEEKSGLDSLQGKTQAANDTIDFEGFVDDQYEEYDNTDTIFDPDRLHFSDVMRSLGMSWRCFA